MEKAVIAAVISDFRKCWRDLLIVDIACKTLALVVLAPVATFFFRASLWFSGRAVVADEDILYIVLSPAGLISIILVGAVVFGITAVELSGLMAVAFRVARNSPAGYRDAFGIVLRRLIPILWISGRFTVQLLLVTVPFLAVVALVYFFLLGDFDINYYLSRKPPAFYMAVGVAAIFTSIWLYLVFRLCMRWFVGIPILLFENLSDAVALSESRMRVQGKIKPILFNLAVWAFAVVALSIQSSYLVAILGEGIVPRLTHDLRLLSFGILIIVIITAILNLFVNFLGVSILSIMAVRFSLRYEILTAPDTNEVFFRSRFHRILPSGKVFVSMALGSVVLSTGALFSGIYGIQAKDHTSITAHRGASASAPENTLAAVDRAIQEGADYVEIDVQETTSGEIVVFHDSDFKRTAGTRLKIRDASSADLTQIDIGSWFSPEFSNQRIPTLNQVLQLCKGRIRVNIELKYYGYKAGMEERVIEIVESNGMESEIVVMSLNSNAVGRMKELRPDWKTGMLTAVAIGDLTRLNVDFLAVSARMATRDLVMKANRGGKELYVWTVNDPVLMSVMISRGVNSLITDKPSLAVSVLQQRAEMNSIERLLLELSVLFDAIPYDSASLQQ